MDPNMLLLNFPSTVSILVYLQSILGRICLDSLAKGIEAAVVEREKGNAERQTEMKRADVPPQRRREGRGETGREEAYEKGKQGKRRSRSAKGRGRKEEIFWAQ